MAGYNITQNRKITSRAIISALALVVVFCGMAAAEQFYVNESGWWRDGGAFNASGAPIHAAVDAADAGDSIYVWNGSYTENVDVNKTLTLEGEDADVVTVTAASSSTIFKVTANYVNISGFAVRGATDSYAAGLYLGNADYCNISGNNAYGNEHGIYLLVSSNNTLTNNTVNSNYLYGIRMDRSSNNTLVGNIMSGNYYNFGVSGSSFSDFIQNMGASNLVNEKPVYYWVNRRDEQVPYDAGFVGIVNSTNITVRDLTLTNNSVGVLFAYTDNSKIGNITASNNNDGIRLTYSSNNTLTNNTANLNRGYATWYGNPNGHGICLSSSSNNTLTNNTANLNNGYGIYLYSSSNNMLQSSTANSNDLLGIHLSVSSNNILTNNTVNSNDYHGIYLYSSSNNTLTNNTASSNDYGIYITGYSNDNNITCNWVQNNTQGGFYLIDPWFWYGGLTNNIISHNNIIENGNYNTSTGGWEWQFYNDQPKAVDAKHNYWGAKMNSSTIDASVFECGGEVVFYPFETEPVRCPPTPEEPPAFTTTDAVIALQIAVGSRPPDLQWDVSGDDRVTSLDALMILQAACGR